MQPDLPVMSRPAQWEVSRSRVLRNTYLLLGLSLIPTIIGAMVGINLDFSFMRASPIMSSLILLAVVYGLFFAIEKNKDSGVGVALLLGLTLLLGLMLGPILQFALSLKNGAQLVSLAAGGTAVTFFSLAGIATVTKKDFSFLGKFLMVGAIVLMIAVVANLFLQLPTFQLTLSALFILFCSLAILYTVSGLVNGGETNYITATLTLYMSIYNIFVSLLNLLMAFSGDRD
jgi:modulator of FtsH protease